MKKIYDRAKDKFQTEKWLVCPKCGLMEEDWNINNRRGYKLNGQSYCCLGCAEYDECNCLQDWAW